MQHLLLSSFWVLPFLSILLFKFYHITSTDQSPWTLSSTRMSLDAGGNPYSAASPAGTTRMPWTAPSCTVGKHCRKMTPLISPPTSMSCSIPWKRLKSSTWLLLWRHRWSTNRCCCRWCKFCLNIIEVYWRVFLRGNPNSQSNATECWGLMEATCMT